MFWVTGRRKASDSRATSNLGVVLLIKAVLWKKRTSASENESQIKILLLTQSHLLLKAQRFSSQVLIECVCEFCLLFLNPIAMVPWKWLWTSESLTGAGKAPLEDRMTDTKTLKMIFLSCSLYPFRQPGIRRFPKQFQREATARLTLAGYSASAAVGHKRP